MLAFGRTLIYVVEIEIEIEIHQSKEMYYNTKNESLLRHAAWKRSGPILISALHTFANYLLT